MYKRLSFLSLFLLALTLGSSDIARAKDSAAQISDRRAIVAAQTRLNNARMTKDLDIIMSYLADDFRLYTINRNQQDRQTYGRVQVFAWNMAKNAPAPVIKTTVSKWQWRGPDAIVWTTMTIAYKGQKGNSGGLVRSREYWGKTNKGWQLRQIVELSGKVVINGETAEI